MTHAELLQLVYNRFRASGNWPLVSDLRVELRDEGNVRVLATEIGADKIVCENRDGGVCRLHFATLAACENAEEDVTNVLAAFRYLAHRYITEQARLVSSAEILAELKLPSLAGTRMSRILPSAATETWESYSSGEDGSFVNMKLLDGVVPYEKVTTLAQFIATGARVRNEARIIAGIQWREPAQPTVREQLESATRASVAASVATSAAVSMSTTPPATRGARDDLLVALA